MPDDRLLHKSATHSEKVSQLTDFEYRVWTTYLLCADDFGVMRASASTLRAGNDALEHKPAKMLERALDRLVQIGLVRAFEHQGKTYLYQSNWQDYQNVRYPRLSVHPIPGQALIADCSEAQQKLFASKCRKVSAESPQKPSNVSAESPTPARAGGREWLTANGKRLMATGKRQEPDDGFDAFWTCYPKKKSRQDALKAWRKLKPDAALQAEIATAVAAQARSPDWLKEGGRFIPYAATWLHGARWTDQTVELPQVSDKTLRNMQAIYGDRDDQRRTG